MDRTFLASAALTLSALGGYLVGIASPYPGREASLVGVMVGVTLAAVTYGRRSVDDDTERDPAGDETASNAEAPGAAGAANGGESP